MVKAVVRAMDTISAFLNETRGLTINKYGLSGSSKRGWTTWIAGAIDPRVIAFTPIVMSLLNESANMHHYYRSLGGWPYEFEDYYFENITKNIDEPESALLWEIVDPYSYVERMNKPKLMVSSSNDEFF